MKPSPSTNLVALDGRASAWCGGAVLPALESLLDMAELWAPGTFVGISGANRSGTYTTLVANHQVVFDLDSLQNDLDEGPGLTALREDHTVVVDDAESEHRWGVFTSRAVEAGMRSILSVPLVLGSKTFGALNLYSATYLPVDMARLAQAKLLAGQAALALAQAQREHQLTVALETNRVVGKAVGLAMERFGLDDHAAFAYLTTLAQKSTIDLREIARHFVDQANALHTSADRPDDSGQPDVSGVPMVTAHPAVTPHSTVTAHADSSTQPARAPEVVAATLSTASDTDETHGPSGTPVAEPGWPAVAVES
ncbi:GAF and ANTAR domain-containing protein [Phycicoccus sp. M110.8]|uniref:GAF and ANTAR domain-containing protein n=1 Tax=Phycicoccus sp. M110.8 TaxID=3075433 RepID=UPI0028FD74C6|nr:GAF and ANTAR domain-containing protein [Phycicoccus sp. M110.8]MDU0312134.1 GAF and ANTAR domain-containing protein [Phycicoccus sp. M110.8]